MKKIFVFLLPLVIAASVGCNNSSNNSDEITILYTNDVHGALGGDLSYASVAQMKSDLKHQGKKVLLFDNGDHASGGLYCSYLDGLPIVNIMNNVGYDAAIFGNHEFDHGFDAIKSYELFANFPYIATNLYNYSPTKKEITTPYTNTSYVFTLGNINVGVVGVSTPYTITTSTPSYFQDDEGNYIYSFLGEGKGEELIDAVQKEVDMLHNEKQCNYIICLSHIGNDESSSSLFTSKWLVENTNGIDAVLDGHTHVVDPGTLVKNKDGKEILIAQTGSHFKNIGKLTINSQGAITNELVNTYSGKNQTVYELENKIINKTQEDFGVKLATTSIDFIAHDDDGKWLLRRQETNLGDLCADAYYYCLNGVIDDDISCDISIVNSGSIRDDVKCVDGSRTWKLLDCRTVQAFDNNICIRKVKGSDLKTYLEFATRYINKEAASEFGIFPQVQGITFKINSNVTSDIVVDEKGNYESGPTAGHEKISELKVYDKTNKTYYDYNPNKDYYIGGSTYVLEEGGDGCTMFSERGETAYRTSTYVDYQILAEYVRAFKTNDGLPVISSKTSPLCGGDLKLNYENSPDGSERFTVI